MESDQKRSHPLKIALLGYGKMGKLIETMAQAKGHSIAACLDSKTPASLLQNLDFDIAIDFSHPNAVLDHLHLLGPLGKNLVVGTTGWYERLPEVQQVMQNHPIGFLYSPNFSIGVALFKMIVHEAAKIMKGIGSYDVCGLETHHKHKEDAPSGTAKLLEEIVVRQMQKSIPFTSLRSGHFPGTHTLVFDSLCDTITLTHTARNREGFASGAVEAAEWLYGRQGLFTMDDMILGQDENRLKTRQE